MSLGSAQVCLGLSFMNWRVPEIALISQRCDRYAYLLQQFWKMLAKFLPARMCIFLKDTTHSLHSSQRIAWVPYSVSAFVFSRVTISITFMQVVL